MRRVFDDFDTVLPVSNPPGHEWWVLADGGERAGRVIGWAVSLGSSAAGEPTVALPLMIHEGMVGALAVEARVTLVPAVDATPAG
jgi:hypothetical protein